MDLDDSKQLDEKARLDIVQLKEQLETQVHVFYTCTCMYTDQSAYSNAMLKAQEMQSALKKQEKVWKTRMQKLGASYLDQLKDVG